MTILIENEAEKELDFDYEAVTKAVVKKVLEIEKCPYETEINVLITGNDEIRRINNEFRDIDKATDVLSFPALDYKKPAVFDFVEDSPDEYMNRETDELILGDIMVSADKVYEQAKEYGHGRKREFAFLITHSMLHLLGYDHIEDDERKIMEEKQENILRLLEISRNEE